MISHRFLMYVSLSSMILNALLAFYMSFYNTQAALINLFFAVISTFNFLRHEKLVSGKKGAK